MWQFLSGLGGRFRLLTNRAAGTLGMGDDAFLLALAIVIGVLGSIAAYAFHEAIDLVRHTLYQRFSPEILYGPGLVFLILFPALGGLVVGLTVWAIRRFSREGQFREGHGVVDVMESVVRTTGFVKPLTALEKIWTSAVTIGTGGASGAEGPIVQIGAAISSGVGSLFQIPRHQMPILIGCGTAAGISAIFNAPLGGLLFTIEVILVQFNIRTLTPLIVSSVVANVTMRAIFASFDPGNYGSLFGKPQFLSPGATVLAFDQVLNFAVLGLLCGAIGVGFIRLMQVGDKLFVPLRRLGPFRPMLGGALLGVLGVVYILTIGRGLLDAQVKPFAFDVYAMPAFFGDSYGVINRLLSSDFYLLSYTAPKLAILLGVLVLFKLLGTTLTLSSGGSGGVIAPSLFIGAALGGLFGVMLRQLGFIGTLGPEAFALVGMGAVLAAVVHAPLASVLILFEITQDYRVTLAAMLASVLATGLGRLLYKDSIYTSALRHRGVRVGSETNLLQQLSVEQVPLDPASVVQVNEPFQRILDLMAQMQATQFVVIDSRGLYGGMVVPDDINLMIMQREAIPLTIVGELVRDVPLVKNTDDLHTVFELFSRQDLTHLPVTLDTAPGKVIGLISRAAVMRRYQKGLEA